MIVEEVDGKSFWSGQSFLADCAVSSSYRPPGSVELVARELVNRYNSRADLLAALEHCVRALDGALITSRPEALARARAAIARAKGAA